MNDGFLILLACVVGVIVVTGLELTLFCPCRGRKPRPRWVVVGVETRNKTQKNGETHDPSTMQ